MNFYERLRRNGPVFHTHVKAHHAVLANEYWFSDATPRMGRQFTAEKARERKAEIINLLYRTAKRAQRYGNLDVATGLELLADKLFYCQPARRCGSLACPECSRAFQKAKVAAQRTTIKQLRGTRKGKLLVMVTIIPLMVTYKPEDLPVLKVQKLNRWLKDALTKAGFKRVMLGSIDLSWEDGFYQPHWHIAMWTSDRKRLRRRLKSIFPGLQRGDRPVHTSPTYSLGFLPYKDKAIKLPALMRNNRRGLPYLLLALNGTEPLELMVLSGVRVSTQKGGLKFKKIERR
ncbi:hypothetical protein CT676_32875 [Bradyrhizobium sp. MOS001]|uniref:hypothetical protein n=1 Tax=Bradyrhizobium sp. MOS001 TaxID=2133948 RepID=UPI001074DAD2|nr:hypothetical protein [Bradyrhizobium sp. MOS001]TFW56900.1 hypothetical protein CT676_32875 [Bradyrhizobium sp. MOS001]